MEGIIVELLLYSLMRLRRHMKECAILDKTITLPRYTLPHMEGYLLPTAHM